MKQMTNKDIWNWSADMDEIQDLFLDVLNGKYDIEEARQIITRKDETNDTND
jgi:hypothetical protein